VTDSEDGPYGGKNGTAWTDEEYKHNGPITAMEIGSGDILDSIKVRLKD
jgi:hypothetical protein